MPLPPSLDPYTDVYFLRSLQILKNLDLNPFVRAQGFLRQGPGKIGGIKEVLEIIKTHSQLLENQGRIHYLPEREIYQSGAVLLLEGHAQDVIPLETVILGVISAETTQMNDNHGVNLEQVTHSIRAIKTLVHPRPVLYFGARHWRYDEDESISNAALAGGADGVSTGQSGVGTIPHSLESIFAWKYGLDRAVLESTKAFDQIIDKTIPRIALVDYANKEVDDALLVAAELKDSLAGIRVDTCGENVMQGATRIGDRKYWYGTGVTVSGVYNLRKSLNAAGYAHLKIILSSGFGDIEKVAAFVEAEKELKTALFDSLGVGNILGSRIATMDIVGVGETINEIMQCSKVGRSYRPNERLISAK